MKRKLTITVVFNSEVNMEKTLNKAIDTFGRAIKEKKGLPDMELIGHDFDDMENNFKVEVSQIDETEMTRENLNENNLVKY